MATCDAVISATAVLVAMLSEVPEVMGCYCIRYAAPNEDTY